MTSSWKLKAEAKRQRSCPISESNKLPEELLKSLNSDFSKSVLDVPSMVLSPTQLEITEKYDATGLLEQLSTGNLTAVNVLSAFQARAEIVQQITNCLTNTRLPETLERAIFLDKYFAEHGKPIGPLHGLPISVKDSFDIKDVNSTLGVVALIDDAEKTQNATVVRILTDLGAIVFVKTNIPQGITTSNSENNIFGRTLNPHNRLLSAGGSSAGEGSLVAQRGSLLGVGTDLGGSIRIPSWCNGVYGFKPSINRIPYKGVSDPGIDTRVGVIASAGPFATSVRDLELFMRVVLDSTPSKYDSRCLPIGWNNIHKRLNTSEIHVGVIEQDPDLLVDSDVRFALNSSSEKLASAGVYVSHLKDFPSIPGLSKVISKLYDVDNNSTTLNLIKSGNEPFVESLKSNYSNWENIVPGTATLEDLIKFSKEVEEYRDRWLDVFDKNNLDVIMLPCATSFAPSSKYFTDLPYCENWNGLDVSKDSAAALICFLV